MGQTVIMNKQHFVPRTRYMRELRKWHRKIRAGDEVYITRCGKKAMLVMVYPKEKFDAFKAALERPPRDCPEAIKQLLDTKVPWDD